MYNNVHIKGIGSYHPNRTVDNEYFINHFKQYDKDEQVKSLIEKLGRKQRNFAEENENSVTMEVNAAKKALENAGLTPIDIDMIISASDTPEFLTPNCALIIKNELQASNVTGVFDVNSDCIGMLTAMDVASRYLKTDSKKYKRILIVGSLLISPFARTDDLIIYPMLGDGAAAIILEVREEEELRGLLGSRMFTDALYNETIRFPACGLSNIAKEDVCEYDKIMEWNPFSFSFLSDKWSVLITELLDEHGYTPESVSHYFMSQFSISDIELTLEKLGTSMEKTTFVGDKYGYTGCPSPIMALDDMLSNKRFMEKELIIFCSVAAGYTMTSLLYKW